MIFENNLTLQDEEAVVREKKGVMIWFDASINGRAHKTLPIKSIRKILSTHYLEMIDTESKEAWVGFLSGGTGKLEMGLGYMKRPKIIDGRVLYLQAVGIITIAWKRHTDLAGYEVTVYVI